MSRAAFYRLCNTFGHDLARDLALQASGITLAQVQLWAASYKLPSNWTGGQSTKRGVTA